MKTLTLNALIASAVTLGGAFTTAAADPYRSERVEFVSNGETIVGTLYLPADAGTTRLPGVVVTGAWTTVKEQMAGRYASELASRGVAALAFDFRHWGESGGTARELEHPTLKIQDIHAAVDFLAGHSGVDPGRIGGLGICASAGYMAAAAATDPTLGRIALVAPWLHDAAIVDAVYGGREKVEALIETGRRAQADFDRDGTLTRIVAAGKSDGEVLMPGEHYYSDPARGLIEAWPNRFNLASWEPWLTFDAQRFAPMLRAPTLIVHSEAAAIPEGAQRFLANLRAPARAVWLDGVTQFDFYDQDEAVATASDAVAAHLKASAAPTAPLGATEATSVAAAEARVIATVSAIPLAVDLGDWTLAESHFAAEVVVDYTSLWGGAAQTLARSELISAWRDLVPGFDATRHELGDVRARIDGQTATASAFVDGRHWIGDALWRPVGTYHFGLVRSDGAWKVARMRFDLLAENGDRALVTQARERIAAR
jgi:dienelactone hydrolase